MSLFLSFYNNYEDVPLIIKQERFPYLCPINTLYRNFVIIFEDRRPLSLLFFQILNKLIFNKINNTYLKGDIETSMLKRILPLSFF